MCCGAGPEQGFGELLPPCVATGRRSASNPRRLALLRTQAHSPRAASCPSPRSPRDDCQAGDAIAGGRTRPEQGSTARVGGGVQVGLPTLALLSSSDGCASIGCRGVPAGHCQGTACGGVAYCTEHLFVCLECGCFPYCLVCVTGSHGCRRPPRPPPPPPVLLGPTGADYDAALASAAKDATLQQHGGGSHGSDEVPAPRLVRYSVLVSRASRPVLDGRAINFYYREVPHVDWGNIAASNEIPAVGPSASVEMRSEWAYADVETGWVYGQYDARPKGLKLRQVSTRKAVWLGNWPALPPPPTRPTPGVSGGGNHSSSLVSGDGDASDFAPAERHGRPGHPSPRPWPPDRVARMCQDRWRRRAIVGLAPGLQHSPLAAATAHEREER